MDNSRIESFIRKQNVAFICSVDEAGYPNVKAMLKPRKINGLRQFYFSTNTSSMRVKQYMNNSNACIYFYHKGLIKYKGVMLKGTMEVLTDQKTKDMIWRKGDTMFYKGGVTDPDYCVLRFTGAVPGLHVFYGSIIWVVKDLKNQGLMQYLHRTLSGARNISGTIRRQEQMILCGPSKTRR